MQEYFCHKCEKGFIPQDESECHMIADPKTKFTWLFKCTICFKDIITPEEFKREVEKIRSQLQNENRS